MGWPQKEYPVKARLGWTDTVRTQFLAALGKGYTANGAALLAGISRATAFAKRSENPEFAQQWEEAVECGKDALEDEARRRAVKGVLKPVWYQGQKVGHNREFSDYLLVAMLKARRPEYRDSTKLETTLNINVATILDEAKARVKAARPESKLLEGDRS